MSYCAITREIVKTGTGEALMKDQDIQRAYMGL